MRKTLTTAALVLALSCLAFAGEMHTPPAPAPPPPTNAAQEPTTEATTEGGTQDGMTEVVLDLLTLLPSLL